MSPNCPHCGSPLFTPDAMMCAGRALDVNVWETSRGNLRRIWLYDRVAPPEICITCGEALPDALEEISIGCSADAPEAERDSISRIAESAAGALTGFFWLRWFVGRIEKTDDQMEVKAKICAPCKALELLRTINIDRDQRRFEVFCCEAFYQATTP